MIQDVKSEGISIVKSEGISIGDVVPLYCSCVQSSSSCTGSMVKNGNPYYQEIHRGEIILSQVLSFNEYKSSYYREIHITTGNW